MPSFDCLKIPNSRMDLPRLSSLELLGIMTATTDCADLLVFDSRISVVRGACPVYNLSAIENLGPIMPQGKIVAASAICRLPSLGDLRLVQAIVTKPGFRVQIQTLALCLPGFSRCRCSFAQLCLISLTDNPRHHSCLGLGSHLVRMRPVDLGRNN